MVCEFTALSHDIECHYVAEVGRRGASSVKLQVRHISPSSSPPLYVKVCIK